MNKFIFEFKNECSCKEPCKNQYRIVYENKTFYYCKVNGTDELIKFHKDRENKRISNGEFWSTDNFDVDEALKISKYNKKQNSLQNIYSQLAYKQREIELLIKEKELLEKMKE